MNIALRSIVGVAALLVAAQASAQITFYEREGFRGQAFATDKQVSNFERAGFNDRASSVVVDRGRWEVCEDARFEGRCVVLRRGSYDSLPGIGAGEPHFVRSPTRKPPERFQRSAAATCSSQL